MSDKVWTRRERKPKLGSRSENNTSQTVDSKSRISSSLSAEAQRSILCGYYDILNGKSDDIELAKDPPLYVQSDQYRPHEKICKLPQNTPSGKVKKTNCLTRRIEGVIDVLDELRVDKGEECVLSPRLGRRNSAPLVYCKWPTQAEIHAS